MTTFSLTEKILEAERIDFLTRYLLQLSESIKEGTPVMGYFHWSFTDNFEWHSGYDERFGLVYIDYPTQKRIPKDSYYWYRNLLQTLQNKPQIYGISYTSFTAVNASLKIK